MATIDQYHGGERRHIIASTSPTIRCATSHIHDAAHRKRKWLSRCGLWAFVDTDKTFRRQRKLQNFLNYFQKFKYLDKF